MGLGYNVMPMKEETTVCNNLGIICGKGGIAGKNFHQYMKILRANGDVIPLFEKRTIDGVDTFTSVYEFCIDDYGLMLDISYAISFSASPDSMTVRWFRDYLNYMSGFSLGQLRTWDRPHYVEVLGEFNLNMLCSRINDALYPSTFPNNRKSFRKTL